MQIISLFNKKEECCGCRACVNICPKQAIAMEKDEYGFLYPNIDYDLCVKCGACKRVCAFQKDDMERYVPLAVFAGADSNEKRIISSTSGGIFATVATNIINKGGVVYGCAMVKKGEILSPEHIRVDSLTDLIKLQGSKYVQSTMGDTYKEVKKDLLDDKIVLFSGTPCQVASLKCFLLNVKTDNLYTIDIICHGVPSADFFQGYISELGKKYSAEVLNFKFRFKPQNWGGYG